MQSDRVQFFKNLGLPFLASQARHSRCIAAMVAQLFFKGGEIADL
jgi:hypothetical protein